MSEFLRHAIAYEKLLSEKEALEHRLTDSAGREQSLMLQLAEAEEEINSLKVQRRIDTDHRSMYCQMKNEAEDRIRAASGLVNKMDIGILELDDPEISYHPIVVGLKKMLLHYQKRLKGALGMEAN